MIFIICGAYGSGKSEYSATLALKKRNSTIVDLDIMNPYFRTRELQEIFDKNGVELIAPKGSLKYADVPIIPPQIRGVIENRDKNVIIDLGGESGAKVITQFHDSLVKSMYEMHFVVNTFRPDTDTEQKIINMKNIIQNSSSLQISHIISNNNLMEETTKNMIISGIKFLQPIAKRENLKLHRFLIGKQFASIVENRILGVKKMVIGPLLKKPWEI